MFVGHVFTLGTLEAIANDLQADGRDEFAAMFNDLAGATKRQGRVHGTMFLTAWQSGQIALASRTFRDHRRNLLRAWLPPLEANDAARAVDEANRLVRMHGGME